jgi:rhodanese-related sulfurtransferase
LNFSYIKRLSFFALALAFFSQSLIARDTIAAEEQSCKAVNSPTKQHRPSGAYCGIYCLYAVMKLADIDIDPKEVLKPEYIGSAGGSSLAELKKAAENYGMHAAAVGRLTTRELRQSPYPIILHVKSAADKKEYDHYELFLETENGHARLYNPPEPVVVVPFYELAPRWDGTGLIVSAKPIDINTIFASARKRFVMYAAIAVVIILMIRWGRRRWVSPATTMSRQRLLGLSAAQGAGLVFAAMICGMICHFASDEGFLAHPNDTDSIQQAHIGNFIPKIREKEIAELLNTDAVLIDARFACDFEEGHLEGAINIPVDTNDQQRCRALANIDKDARIVVYCQSGGCGFAERVAIKLMSDGFSNVSIFEGGRHE